MIVKRNGGMTEFIPSPREKRESLIRDHVLELVGLLHERLCLIEEASGIDAEPAERCRRLLDRVSAEEKEIRKINQALLLPHEKTNELGKGTIRSPTIP